MAVDRAFGYAQARMQARFALLPDEEDWARLAPIRSLPAFLEEARRASFAHWLRGIAPHGDAHELERSLRVQYRDTVDLVTGWVPEPWREAVAWLRWLPWLPWLAHLSRHGRLPPWGRDDFVMRALIDTAGQARPEVLRKTGLAPLLDPAGGVAERWQAEWLGRWPPCRRGLRAPLERLLDLLAEHGIGGEAGASIALRRALRERLHARFRRDLLQPAAVFIFLGLIGLDLERLRGELLGRALFDAGPA